MTVPFIGVIPQALPLHAAVFSARDDSLADTKAAEDRAQELVGAEGARDLAKRDMRSAKLLRHEFERRIAGQSMVLRCAKVGSRTLQGRDMASASHEESFGLRLPAGTDQELGSQVTETFACHGGNDHC